MRHGRVKSASTCSLSVTNEYLQGIYDDIDFFKDKLVLRPSEISNNPEVIRRLGDFFLNLFETAVGIAKEQKAEHSVRGKMNLPSRGKDFFHCTVSRIFTAQ